MSNTARMYVMTVHNIASAICSPGQVRLPNPKTTRVGSAVPGIEPTSTFSDLVTFGRNRSGLNLLGDGYCVSSWHINLIFDVRSCQNTEWFQTYHMFVTIEELAGISIPLYSSAFVDWWKRPGMNPSVRLSLH